ncbi:MAG: hypothetical protein ACOYNY_42520 [Caldilineaceae bacterium]
MLFEVPTPPGALRRTASLPHHQPTRQQLFTFMGEQIRVQTNSAAVLEAARLAFDRFPPAPATDVPPTGAPPLVIDLFVEPPKDPAADLPSSALPQPVFHTKGHLFHLNVGLANSLLVDMQTGYSVGFLTPAVVQDLSFIRNVFLELPAQAMLGLARDFVAIHAACVVKDGVSVLIQGESGTGKSTLAFASLRRGFQILAEDVVQVKVQSERLHLWGIPWKFHLLRDSLRFFPELADHQLRMQVNGEWKLEVELDELIAGATITNAPPGLLVFLERTTTPPGTHIERLSPAETRQRFSAVWSWEVGWQDLYDQVLTRWLAQGSYRLLMNGTPDEAVDALAALIDQQA